MAALHETLRKQLEKTVVAARDDAEEAAREALQRLAVDQPKVFEHMSADERELRNSLRAKARQLGDRRDKSGRQAIDHLVVECAYEHWHRMLFSRFLAENHLLIHDEMNVPVSLHECEELAKEEGTDGWTLAARFASQVLPQIFRPDDPVLAVKLAPESKRALEKQLATLPVEVFTADDSLGWVYQFWQAKRKDEVNKSGVKIGADELPAVTQLFTEPYMVHFLLHNTLGAWWAGKRLSDEATKRRSDEANSEAELRKLVSLPGVEWEYLRFVRGEDGKSGRWRPAAGTFDGWPKTAAKLKVLDPCCGSGHFLVAALRYLVPIRMAEEGLSAREAVDAVLRDNLYGLEIDERCCQIAAFALALGAWTYADAGGYRPLHGVHIACTGIGPRCTAEEWLKLAEHSDVPMPAVGRQAIENGLLNLHRLFSQAPTLGSLINPSELPADLIAADYQTIQPYLAAIIRAEQAEDEIRERAIAAAGMVKAVGLLAGEYTLIITNVPYLSVSKQDPLLRRFCEDNYPRAKHDLATVVLQRIGELAMAGGTAAAVVPQLWLFLTRYRAFREDMLRRTCWNVLARLGPSAFETISGEVVNVVLVIVSHHLAPSQECVFSVWDASEAGTSKEKSLALRDIAVQTQSQSGQLRNPDSRVVLSNRADHALLLARAESRYGLRTADSPRFIQCFWENVIPSINWRFHQSTVRETRPFAGREHILLWQNGSGALADFAEQGLASLQGQEAWGRQGVIVSLMGSLPATIYTGESFDNNCAAVWVRAPADLTAVWQFYQSEEFASEVRIIDQALKVTNLSILKVPFDVDHWQKVAAKKYPDGLPEPESDDPTQWLFHGRPDEAHEGTQLQVAVARLLGYRWPAELDGKMRLSERARELVERCDELADFVDDDGVVCILSVRGERPAADRVRELLAAAYHDDWSPAKQEELLDSVGFGGKSLDEWLRNGFFEQHYKLFHHRPFIWHIWDGRKKDGFGALVDYHKLDARLLERLTYTYLGDWIRRQEQAVAQGESGADARLLAAQRLQDKLKLIAAGDPPYDIFARWKPLDQQPIGWNPDLNDGVRMNIRPFMEADLLRKRPNIKWTKDRGKEPKRPKEQYPWFYDEDGEFTGARVNDIHLTTAEKRAVRSQVAPA